MKIATVKVIGEHVLVELIIAPKFVWNRGEAEFNMRNEFSKRG
jgi:hypothetical protein